MQTATPSRTSPPVPSQASPTDDAAKWCVSASERCVMCGLCLPHCPTYKLERNEADSPRGRISLIKAFAADELAPDKTLVAHLEGCLQCRRCEAVCPAQVPFGRLMDTAKRLLFDVRAPSLTRLPRRLAWLVTSHRLRRLTLWSLYLYQRSGLRRLLRASGLLKMLRLDATDAMLPAVTMTPLTSSTPSLDPGLDPGLGAPRVEDQTIDKGESGERVTLFTGCVAEIFDRDTLRSAKHLLEAVGFSVTVPAQQTCCGALHQHAGDAVRARRFVQKNADTFASGAPQTVVSCASGCGAQLKEHEATLGIRHFDIHALLEKHLEQHADALSFHALNKPVALHTPCTMDSCLHNAPAVTGLLARIPGLRLATLPAGGCCGAAGAYMLTHPDAAQRLLAETLEPLAHTGAELLLSSNIGCIMHLRQGIARRGMNVEVMHTATLLARQLKRHDHA